jgi:hypothetical protein
MTPGTETYALYDSATEEVKFVPRGELDKKLDELSRVLKSHLARLEHIGKYDLEGLKVKIALKAGILVFSAEGGVELSYRRGSESSTH